MFEFSFWKLVVIGVVALIVIGPERLPGVARTAGLWFGRARRMVASVREDIEREIKAEELKRIMQQQAQSAGLHEIVEEGRYTLDGLKEELEIAGSTGKSEHAAGSATAPADTAHSGGHEAAAAAQHHAAPAAEVASAPSTPETKP